MAVGRSYTAGRFALELDGTPAGFLASARGGDAFGHVVEGEPQGSRVPKRIAGVGYTPLVVEVALPLTEPLLGWVAATLDGGYSAHAGALLSIDSSSRIQQRLDWTGGFITAVAFPATDATSKDPARVRVTIEAEQTRVVASSGDYPSPLKSVQKQVLVSNFRFAVSGLEAAGRTVSKVSALTASRRVDNSQGLEREYMKVGAVVDVADVALWLPTTDAAEYVRWFDELVLRGKSEAGQRTASLVFLDAGLKADVVRVDLEGVGIHRISHEAEPSGLETVPRVKVELYCEALRLRI